MEAVDVRGRFVWHQLLTRDVPGAKKFYPSLTGWKAQAWPLDPSYTVCHSGDVPTAGMMAMAPEFPAEVPAHWMPYIGTRDVDGVAEAAVLAGGYIVKQPSDMKGAGRYAVLADPQGAVFAIIDPENARAEEKGMPPPGQFSWHELGTTDNEAAFAFYSNLFGWDAVRRMDMGDSGVYLIFGWNGEERGGIYIKPPTAPSQPSWLLYARVPDLDAAVSAVEEGGGKVVQPPMDVPGGGRIAVLTDPAGAAFALHSASAGALAEPSMAKASSASKAAAKARPKAKAMPAVKPKPAVKARPAAKSKPKTKASIKAKTKKSPPRKTAAKKSRSKVKLKARSRVTAKARPKVKAKTKVKTKARAQARKKVVRRKK